MEKKYEFTDETIEFRGVTLHRIRALRNFGVIKKGNLGGFIQHEDNLSHDGNCWVGGDAFVLSCACVSDNAQIYDDAEVYGSARIKDNAHVYGNAEIYGTATVSGHARIYGNAKIYRDADIDGDNVMSTGEKAW